jgi:hypothetical protein
MNDYRKMETKGPGVHGPELLDVRRKSREAQQGDYNPLDLRGYRIDSRRRNRKRVLEANCVPVFGA